MDLCDNGILYFSSLVYIFSFSKLNDLRSVLTPLTYCSILITDIGQQEKKYKQT